ncbi:MAG TPA: SDR family oxidoreductase [Xanthomonadales bacterium]|nr:SDR family oxidoreductase [Xanthomonadales bacterium]
MSDAFSIRGSRTLIVGGTAGIGLGVAQHFTTGGAEVIIAGRRSSGSDIAREIGARFVTLDLADSRSITEGMQRAAAELGGVIDTLILNAGITAESGDVAELDMNLFRKVFEINLFGVAQALRDGLRYMREGGSVIVTSSPAALQLVPGISAYAASKAAVNTLVQTAALELGPSGIRVNAVLPGVVETEMALNPEELEAELAMLSTFTANGKIRQPEDMGPPFQFLASDAGKTCTGSLLACEDGAMPGFSQILVQKAFS